MMRGFESQKACLEHRGVDEEDMISKLPDCILYQILAFLPTREAVATSILSTRWKPLWTSVPDVDFDDSLLYSNRVTYWHPAQVNCFLNFVERVLLLRDSSKMRRFRLSCRVCFCPTRVRSWISVAISNNAEELDLCLFVDEPFMLPHCLFDNKSLKELKLEMNCILRLPSHISIPCLRTLHLCLVTFPDDISTHRLLCSCPVLQELVLLDCEWTHLNEITISIPSLRTLIIDDQPLFGSSSDIHGCKMKIVAKNLLLFKYCGALSSNIWLCDAPLVVHASVHISSLCKREKLVASRAMQLLGELRHTSFLSISSSTIEAIFMEDPLQQHLLNFQRLTHLELTMELEGHVVSKMIKFIRCLPKLESVCFCEGLKPQLGQTTDSKTLESVPPCFLPSLRIVTLQNCRGSEVEMQFLLSFLGPGSLLEKMTVVWLRSSSRDFNKEAKFHDQLQALKGAMQCVLVFVNHQ